MKRIISLLLTVMMLLSAFTFVVSADESVDILPFTDVKEGAWYYDGVVFCYYMGIVNGMTESSFQPNGTLTRAQLVQILAMYDGADLSVYNGLNCGFEDVKSSHWYSNAVCWAYSNGYVSGMSESRFAPNDPITREQFARILYLYAETWDADVSYRADLSAFEDEHKISSWAYEQMQWAVAIGIISGITETSLAPRNLATRAQACRMIMTFDDYFSMGYLKNDLFFVLVDHVLTNGTVSEYDSAVTEIVETAGEEKFVVSYDSDVDCIYFEYYMGSFDMTDEFGDTYTDHTRAGMVELDDIYESYDLTLYLSDASETNYYIQFAGVYPDGIVPYYEDHTGFSEDHIEYHCGLTKTALNAFIIKHIEAAGIPLEDMFISYDYNRDGAYKTLADHITANGTKGNIGEYTLITLVNGTDFFADYNPISGEIAFRFYENYGSAAGMTMYELSDEYTFSYYYEDYNTGEYVNAERYICADHDEVCLYDHTMDEETAYAMEDAAYTIFCEGMTQLLSDCGLTMTDIFVK